MSFGQVTGAGTTTVTVVDQTEVPPPGNVAVDGVIYEVQTTPSYSGLITPCFSYGGIDFGGASRRLFHFENDVWVDITTLPSVDQRCPADNDRRQHRARDGRICNSALVVRRPRRGHCIECPDAQPFDAPCGRHVRVRPVDQRARARRPADARRQAQPQCASAAHRRQDGLHWAPADGHGRTGRDRKCDPLRGSGLGPRYVVQTFRSAYTTSKKKHARSSTVTTSMSAAVRRIDLLFFAAITRLHSSYGLTLFVAMVHQEDRSVSPVAQ